MSNRRKKREWRCRIRGIQDWRDAGEEGFRTGGMQEKRKLEKTEGEKKERMDAGYWRRGGCGWVADEHVIQYIPSMTKENLFSPAVTE